jgi:excisionase family DNA binding protein
VTPLLDYQAAAERLGVSVRYLRQLVARGAIARRRLGRRVMFSEADLDAYVATTRVQAHYPALAGARVRTPPLYPVPASRPTSLKRSRSS